MKNTIASVVFWIGFAVFAYLKWHFPAGRPTDLVSYMAVGAWMSGGLLLVGEAGMRLMADHVMGAADRSMGASLCFGAVAVGVALGWHLIATSQGGMFVALLVGAGLYLGLLRLPFVTLVRD